MSQLSVEVPEDVLKAIDLEVMRRKLRRPGKSQPTPEEMEEALNITDRDGVPAAKAYLAERAGLRQSAKEGTSRRGIIIEFFLLAFTPFMNETAVPAAKQVKHKKTRGAK